MALSLQRYKMCEIIFLYLPRINYETMKKLLILATTLLMGLGLAAQETGCHFVQNQTRRGETVRMEGILFFAEPDLIRMNYLDPKGDYMILDETMVRSRFAGQARDISVEKDARARIFRAAFVYAYTGKTDALAKEMDAEVSEKAAGGERTVTVTPRRQPQVRGSVTRVQATYDAQGRATRIVLEQGRGSSEYLFDY